MKMKNCTESNCDGQRFNVIIFNEQPQDGEVSGILSNICPTCDDCKTIESGISDNQILMNNNNQDLTVNEANDIIQNVNSGISVHGIGRYTTNSVNILWRASGVGNQLPDSITPNCI